MARPPSSLGRTRVSTSALAGVSLFQVERWSSPHTALNESFSVVYFVQGRSAFWQRGQVHVQGSGAILVSQPEDVYRGTIIHEPVTLQLIRIAPERVEAARRALGSRHSAGDLPMVLTPGSPEAVACLELQRALFGDSEQLEQQVALDDALVHLARLGQRSGGRALNPERVRRAQEYMRAQLHHQLSLDDIAAQADTDTFALIRAFRRHVGMSPYEWLTQMRVQRASRLLSHGAKPSQAAIQVGFYDQSQLHRHFRRILGVTPGAYAKAFSA